MNPFDSRNPNRLYRDPSRGKILGVCAGIADYFGIRAGAVRLAVVAGLIFFTVPTLLGYLAAGMLLPAKPGDLYASREEEAFWRGVRTEPRHTVRDARHRIRELERRLRELEAHVTSREFKLSRDIRDLET